VPVVIADAEKPLRLSVSASLTFFRGTSEFRHRPHKVLLHPIAIIVHLTEAIARLDTSSGGRLFVPFCWQNEVSRHPVTVYEGLLNH
jgi:hypothetical protein